MVSSHARESAGRGERERGPSVRKGGGKELDGAAAKGASASLLACLAMVGGIVGVGVGWMALARGMRNDVSRSISSSLSLDFVVVLGRVDES